VKKQQDQQNAVLIIGMHRSGTSALARVVNLLGVDLNSKLMRPRKEDNERGFWESEKIARIHDHLLEALGTTWDETIPLPKGWIRRHEAAPARNSLLELLRRDFAESQWWAVKDPRVCRLLPLWLDILVELRCRPLCIHITRSPAEVVDSLRLRSDLSPGFGYPLWLDHVLAAEEYSRGVTRAFITYEQLLGDWRGTMLGLADTLEIEWPRAIDEAAPEIESFLSDGLRHQRVADTLLESDSELSPWIHRSYEALKRTACEGESPELRHCFDGIRGEVAAAQRLYGRALASHRAERGELRSEVARRKKIERGLEKDLTDGKRELKRILEKQIIELERRDEEVARANEAFESALQIKNAELRQANESFVAALQRKDEQVASINEFFETRSQELSRLQSEFQEQQVTLEQVRGDLRTRTEVRNQLQAELDALRAKLAETQMQLWSAEARSQKSQREANLERDLAAEQFPRIQELEIELARLDRERSNAEEELARINTTLSWNCTRPLRRLRASLLRRMQPSPRGSTQEAEPISAASATSPAPPEGYEVLRFRASESPQVTIVIPAFDQFDCTYHCLASLLKSIRGIEYEVIVVDDASTDETRALPALTECVRILRREENAGFVSSCNWGAEEARGEYLVFLNNDTLPRQGWLDTLPRQGWLDALLYTFRDHPDVGAVGAMLIYPDGVLQESGGILFRDGSAWNYGRGEDSGLPAFNYVREVDYCSGACLMLPRRLFFALGAFDSRFIPAYYEDTDLCFSVRRAGLRVLVQPLAKVVHLEGQSCGRDLDGGVKQYQVLHHKRFHEKWEKVLEEQALRPESEEDQRRTIPGACERSAGPRVLIIDARTPMPDNDSGSVRMFRLLQILSGLCRHVTFAAETFEYLGHYTAALQHLGVEVLYKPYVDSLERHLEEVAEPYDAVILDRFYVAEKFIDTVRRCAPDAKIILDTVDLHFLRENREIEFAGDSSTDDNFNRVREAELKIARRCDLTLVVSYAEQELLARDFPELPVALLSNVHVPQPTAPSFSERNGILFVGGFEHTPNQDAIRYYAQEIEPLLHEQLPGLVLTVIGRAVPSDILALQSDTVHIIGQVPEIMSYFAEARLSIAPLRFGAGVKGKINSSMSFGVPVVTTGIGAEGIAAVDGEDLLIADDPRAFADAIARAYTDETLWQRLSQRGIENIRQQFSFEVAELALREILDIPPEQPRRSSIDGGLVDRALSLRPTMVDLQETPGMGASAGPE